MKLLFTSIYYTLRNYSVEIHKFTQSTSVFFHFLSKMLISTCLLHLCDFVYD